MGSANDGFLGRDNDLTLGAPYPLTRRFFVAGALAKALESIGCSWVAVVIENASIESSNVLTTHTVSGDAGFIKVAAIDCNLKKLFYFAT